MAEDWFRRKTWSPKYREEFFTRLGRSRGAFHKAQYARIQAYELLSTGTKENCLAALDLTDIILDQWSEDAQLASVYHHRADSFVRLGDLQCALEAYRNVFETQRSRKGERTTAHLDFGWLVATTPLPEYYEEALNLLQEFSLLAFSHRSDRDNAIRALIMEARGEWKNARDFAKSALEAANAQHSGFRYHAKLGLVKSQDEKIFEKLKEMASW